MTFNDATFRVGKGFILCGERAWSLIPGMDFPRMMLGGSLLIVSVLVASSATPKEQFPSGAIPMIDGPGAKLWKRFDLKRDIVGPEVYGGPGYVAPTWKTDGHGLAADGVSDLISRHEFANYELHLDYQSSGPKDGLFLGGRYFVELGKAGGDRKWHSLDLTFTQVEGATPVVSTWIDGATVLKEKNFKKPSVGGYSDSVKLNPENDRGSNKTGKGIYAASAKESATVRLDTDHFMLFARFKTREPLGGTIVSKSPLAGNWKPKAKALFIRGGRVTYDIGWVGAMRGKTPVNDGKWHNVVVCRRKQNVEIYVDGKLEIKQKNFTAADIGSHVIKVGAASPNFAFDYRGLIADVRYYARSVKPKDAENLSRDGKVAGRPAEFRWQAKDLPADDQRPELEFTSIDGVKGPIRITAPSGTLRIANAWIRPLDTVAHAELLAGMKKANYANGERIYGGLCVNCHGKDGITPSLPLSRAFGKGDLKFGTDPYSLYRTLTYGNGNMAAQTWMTEQERYDVIHFIRERYMKPMHPAYRPVTKNYLASLPRKISADLNAGRTKMVRDFGPALASQFERTAESALTVALGDNTTLSYDLHTMDVLAVWNGGFLNVEDTQHMKLRGEGVPRPDGKVNAQLGRWFWGHEGSLDYPKEDLLPRGPVPAKWMDYRGHYVNGQSVVLSYSIDGRAILESPQQQKGFPAVVQSLEVGPGDKALILCVGQADVAEDNFSGVSELVAVSHGWKLGKGGVTGNLLAAGEDMDGKPGQFVAAAITGDTEGLTWETDSRLRLVLMIPSSDKARQIDILRFAGKGEPALQSFAGMARHRVGNVRAQQLASLTRGGATRWPEVLKTRGERGSENQAYTLDTLTIPESNPWNSWFRTAALDFFEDGRMVLATHGGDVWVVSGIDDDLEELKWKRYASGLYEPFGVKVVKGQIYLTCKDRLVRLHDYNGDDEADFYESFSADTDVSFFFHAFNFDLQTDKEGNFFYAKAGQYTDHALPGAVIKVSPDGKKREIYCTGFRTPNGMGMMPDGRPTVSDNQGSWMPASKVSLTSPGGFYGYVQTHSSGARWAPDGGRIDHTKVVAPKTFDQPIIWMPQDFDNSSGGQLYVDDPRWGPLSGRLLHTSFGKGWIYYFMMQDFGDVAQSGIVKMPLDFLSGIQRARVNPKDGQVYAVGLNGWNGGGRPGLGEGGIQRVRFTGRETKLVTDMQVRPGGIEFTFNFDLETKSAKRPGSYDLEQWNYKWQASYGSAQWSVKDPAKQGRDKVAITEVIVGKDGRSVYLKIPGIRPVNQVLAKLKLRGRDGQAFEEEIYLTINRVPKS
jgi:mono/diheme cytochrome c family protein